MKAVTVITHSPSPYQVELFDEIARLGEIDLKVIYLHAKDIQRKWEPSAAGHVHVVLPERGVGDNELPDKVDTSDLMVINYYKHPFPAAALRRRVEKGKAVCFWGERPQARALPWLAELVRGWRLRYLKQSRAQIWGIGRLAVEAYRREFGPDRKFVNLPYFSDLARFVAATRRADDGHCVFLYSGSLSHRKGVDMLAGAFARLATECPHARLRIVGTGTLEGMMRHTLHACSERVEFTGFRDWSDLPQEYGRGDVLCAPSRHDGWGLVVPEGLAAGLPVISTHQTGAAVEFITPGENGWLVPASQEESLYQAMRQAATSGADMWRAMSDHARASVAGHSLQHGARRFVEAASAAITGGNVPREPD